MTKSSGYTRDSTQKEIKELQVKHSPHMQRTRGGFLSKSVKERLLHITNWSEGTSNYDLHQYFYEIREHAKSALGDMHLLCDTLTELQLEQIFGTKEIFDIKSDRVFTLAQYPISNLLEAIIPRIDYRRRGKETEEERKEKEWRKLFLEEIVIMCLDWYLRSGLVKTDSHKRILIDTMDAIAILSSGNKKIERRPEGYYNIIGY